MMLEQKERQIEMKSQLDVMQVRWVGVAPLMCHRGGLASPLDPASRRIKQLSSKRRKTDEDFVDLAFAEFSGGLYFHEEYGPVVPCGNVLSTIVAGARKSKLGREMNLAVYIAGEDGSGVIPIDYDGPRSIEKMWNGGQSKFISSELVNVNRSRILRTRPVFPEWALEFELKYDAQVIDGESVIKAMEDAGFYVGLCEWRPRYGRFEVEVAQ